jgi:hypothetical protein
LWQKIPGVDIAASASGYSHHPRVAKRDIHA